MLTNLCPYPMTTLVDLTFYVIKHLLDLSVQLMFVFMAMKFIDFFILQVEVIVILREIRPRLFWYFSFASDNAFYPFQGHRNIVWSYYCRVRSNKILQSGLSLHQGSTESCKTLEQKFIFQIGTPNPHHRS